MPLLLLEEKYETRREAGRLVGRRMAYRIEGGTCFYYEFSRGQAEIGNLSNALTQKGT